MTIILVILIIFIAVVGTGILFGAPFVPTRKIWIHDAFRLAKIGENDVVIDLGSGDGIVLIEAAKFGAKRAIGYEINPILVAFSRIKIAFFCAKNPKLFAKKVNEKSAQSSEKIREKSGEKNEKIFAKNEKKSRKIEVVSGDFFAKKLPRDTTVIYIFQVSRAMRKIPEFIRENRENLSVKKVKVVCFAFELPGEKIVAEENGMRLYEF